MNMSVWWAKAQLPLRWLPGQRAFWTAKVLMLVRKPWRTSQLFLYQRCCFISPFPNLQKFLQTAYIRLNVDSYQCQLQSGAHGHTSCSKCNQAEDLELLGQLVVAGLWVAGLCCLCWTLEIITQVKLLFLSSYHMYLALFFLIYTMYT